MVDLHRLALFLVEIGKVYLANGGPSSRLEERIDQLAAAYSLRSEAYATPTGLFLTIAKLENPNDFVTRVARIELGNVNLNRLVVVEGLVQQLINRETDLTGAEQAIATLKQNQNNYTVRTIAVGVMGATASIAFFASPLAAIISGILSMLTSIVAGPLASKIKAAGVISDFIATLGVLIACAVLSVLTKLPFAAMAVGSLVYLVPGLHITNAVSELTEQNYVSGTAKLSKAILSILGMGVAYLLFVDFVSILGPMGDDLMIVGQSGKRETELWVALLASFLNIAAFTIIFSTPYSSIPYAILTGMVGYVVFNILKTTDFTILTFFAPAFIVGFLSFSLSRWLRIPSQVFTIPGILSLLPGILALSFFYPFASTAAGGSNPVSLQVAIIAASIVFGLFTARIPFAMVDKSQS